MKITSPTPATYTAPTLKTQAPAQTPPAQDQVQISNQPAEGGVAYGKIAGLGACVAGGAALGVVAGLNPGVLSGALAVTFVPGLAVAGAIIGGIGAEKFGPSSSEYRAIGGAIVGGLVGAGAGLAQAFAVGGAASPVLAATMGVSGACAGVAAFLKLSR